MQFEGPNFILFSVLISESLIIFYYFFYLKSKILNLAMKFKIYKIVVSCMPTSLMFCEAHYYRQLNTLHVP